MQNRIHQYITKGAGHRKKIVGVLVGEMIDQRIHIGWSRANGSKGDKFDRNYGMNLAIERLKAKETVAVPHSIVDAVVKFQSRCHRYFKEATTLEIIPIQPVPKKTLVENE